MVMAAERDARQCKKLAQSTVRWPVGLAAVSHTNAGDGGALVRNQPSQLPNHRLSGQGSQPLGDRIEDLHVLRQSRQGHSVVKCLAKRVRPSADTLEVCCADASECKEE